MTRTEPVRPKKQETNLTRGHLFLARSGSGRDALQFSHLICWKAGKFPINLLAGWSAPRPGSLGIRPVESAPGPENPMGKVVPFRPRPRPFAKEGNIDF